jgi:replication factor C subunit 1
MFTETFRPKKLDDFIGNKSIIQPFVKWLLTWEPSNKKTKCALVSGLCGTGKSLLVELVCNKYNYNIINLSIDEERNKEHITNIIKPLLKTVKTFDGQDNILVVSDIDCGNDYGFISCLTECIKESCIPIICICDNRYDQSIKPILNYSFDIKLSKPTYDDIYALVYKVVTDEKIKISLSGVKKLIESANGDIRFVLNSLQLGNKKGDTSKNIQSHNIFETTGKLLSRETELEEKMNIYWMANDIHSLMIHENYANNILNANDDIKRMENIVYSADTLSDLDIINMEPYISLNTIKATLKCTNKKQIKFPQMLGKISTINKNKREKLDYETAKFIDIKQPKKTKNPEKMEKTKKNGKN